MNKNMKRKRGYIKKLVKSIMEIKPSTREKKTRVIGNIWYKELKEMGIEPHLPTLRAISEGKVSNPESIRRNICKIWEDHPELKPSDEVLCNNIVLQEETRLGRGVIDD